MTTLFHSLITVLLNFLVFNQLIGAATSSSNVVRNLIRGSVLKVTADLGGGLPFEVWKSSVVLQRIKEVEYSGHEKLHRKNDFEILSSVLNERGWRGLWSGLPARTVEGCFSGAVLLAAKETLKKTMSQTPIIRNHLSSSTIAFVAGAGGGAAQAIVMAPCSLLVSASVANHGEDVLTCLQNVWSQHGLGGMYRGASAVAARQATNWASRQGFTELVRPKIKISGIAGEIISGCVGGTLSCWNTPFEIARIENQSRTFLKKGKTVDAPSSISKQNLFGTIRHVIDTRGVAGLYAGILPRVGQSCCQTVFLVCVPRILE